MARKQRKDNKGRVLRVGESQTKDNRYRYQYNDVNGKRCTIWDTDLLSLRAKAEQIQIDSKMGIDTNAGNKVTLNDVFDKYIAGKTELKESTRNNYKYMYNHFVRDRIGGRKIATIKYSDIKAFYTSLLKDDDMKPNTLENVQTVIHPTFTLALRDGLIRTNPTDGIMGEIKKSHSWEKPKRHALTIEEQEHFINHIAESETYNHWLNLFTFLLGTGCRIGEVIGLRWQDIDFDNNIISINHNLIYRQGEDGECSMTITTPKTDAGKRVIPMLSEVKRALLNERREQFKNGGLNKTIIDGYSGFIFTNRNGYVHNPMTINRAIVRIIKEHNEIEVERAEREKREAVIIRHFSVHNLRHTFCTRFCENETNLKIIQEIMGHSDITTTMNIYNEATQSKKQESFKNLEGKIKIS